MAPVAGDHGAHGRFDALAINSSPMLRITTKTGWIGRYLPVVAIPVAFAAQRLLSKRQQQHAA
jgi:hypothetical protein